MTNYCAKRKNKTKIPHRHYRSKINQKIVETEGKLIPRTHIQFIHDRSLSCLGMVINDKDVHRRYTLHEHLGSPTGLVGYVLVHPRVWWGMCWFTPGFGGVCVGSPPGLVGYVLLIFLVFCVMLFTLFVFVMCLVGPKVASFSGLSILYCLFDFL
jgi:hypothetical protein